jgi:hypothetical protein
VLLTVLLQLGRLILECRPQKTRQLPAIHVFVGCFSHGVMTAGQHLRQLPRKNAEAGPPFVPGFKTVSGAQPLCYFPTGPAWLAM